MPPLSDLVARLPWKTAPALATRRRAAVVTPDSEATSSSEWSIHAVPADPTESTDSADGAARVVVRRSGVYAVIDGAAGPQIGTIRGDYVIGFTVSCWDQRRWFPDLDQAKAAIVAEDHAGFLTAAKVPPIRPHEFESGVG
jgi:hypothetical protein